MSRVGYDSGINHMLHVQGLGWIPVIVRPAHPTLSDDHSLHSVSLQRAPKIC